MSKRRLIILSTALMFYLLLSYTVKTSIDLGQPIVFDTVVRNTILSLRNDFLNPLLITLTSLGDSSTIISLCLVLLLIPKTRLSYGLPLSLAALFSSSVQTLMKVMIQRPRPPVETFLISQGGFSFPSGHSCTGLVFYGLLAYLLLYTGVDKSVHKVLARISIALFLTIGISRIYVGVHYPTDVLGGWSLGLAILMGAITCIERIRTRHSFIK